MKMQVLEGLDRQNLGKNFSKKSRKAGYVPAVVYDKHNRFINLHHEQMSEVLRKCGDNALVELRVGPNVTTALIKDVQRHPISGELLHVDLKPVDSAKIVNTKIPINFVNTESIKRQGGIIQTQKNDIEVECKAEDIPRVINIDVSKHNIGNTLKLRDIEVSKEISIIGNPEDIIATLTATKEY